MNPFWMQTSDKRWQDYWRKALTEKRWRAESPQDEHGGFAWECFDTIDEAHAWIEVNDRHGYRIIDTVEELKAEAVP